MPYKRPTRITIISILSLIWGFMTLLNLVFYVRRFDLVLTVVHVSLGFWLLMTGYGLWTRRTWSVTLARICWSGQFLAPLLLTMLYQGLDFRRLTYVVQVPSPLLVAILYPGVIIDVGSFCMAFFLFIAVNTDMLMNTTTTTSAKETNELPPI